MKMLLIVATLYSATLPAAPGKLVDVGGRKLHLYCSGSGAPTVILIAGGSAFSIDWSLVQPVVAATTRVCSYDRAGLGWSDEGPADETVEQTVSDLHTLLQRAGERGPFVLVGASIGGIYIRAYHRQFPSEVAGLVFSNSSNRVGLAANGVNGLLWDLSEEQIRKAFPLPPPPGPAPSREGEPFDRLTPELQATRLQFDMRLWERWKRRPQGPESLLSWRTEFLREFDETELDKEPPLGSVPVVIVSSDPIVSGQRTRRGAATRLEFLSAITIFEDASGSGHEVHLYRPDSVVRAIQTSVAGVRSQPTPK